MILSEETGGVVIRGKGIDESLDHADVTVDVSWCYHMCLDKSYVLQVKDSGVKC